MELHEDMLREGWELIEPSPDRFWEVYQEVVASPPHTTVDMVGKGELVLGFMGNAHPREAMYSTAIAKSLSSVADVWSVRHRSTYFAYKNNREICGFRNAGRLGLSRLCYGPGHRIQQLQRAFGLPIDPFPRPDLYLSTEELAWAAGFRALLPRNKGVAIVGVPPKATRDGVWQKLVSLLGMSHTVLHPLVTQRHVHEETVAGIDWGGDSSLPSYMSDAFVVENYTARNYMALFSIADLYVGMSGGAALSVAAGFSVPAIELSDSNEEDHVPHRYPYHAQLRVPGVSLESANKPHIFFP